MAMFPFTSQLYNFNILRDSKPTQQIWKHSEDILLHHGQQEQPYKGKHLSPLNIN